MALFGKPMQIPSAREALPGEPAELAGSAVFFCSRASDFVTGTALPVDGGFSSSMF
jgi:NAD(P)-dependent dehydrogenase (short-subunit alcohol dehydrogenase family)